MGNYHDEHVTIPYARVKGISPRAYKICFRPLDNYCKIVHRQRERAKGKQDEN